jgi:LDH2 family malate/lactate/ureidoglycolate dehydrogenase
MKIDSSKLSRAATSILIGLGEEPAAAATAAECLVYADMTGVSTHGTYLLKNVYDRVMAKMLNLPTHAKLISDSGATALVDGNNGLGPVATTMAMKIAIEKARQFGIGIVLVRDTNNVGCLGYYTNLAAKHGMVGIMAGNANAAMAPWGGAEAYFGTNPVSIGVPADAMAPIVLDMASSLVARGKIRKASREKKQIPLGWAIDTEGRPTTDPDVALKGTLLPMGGPKGSGLAIMVDLLSGMLAGAKFGPDVKSFHSPDGPTGVGALCIVLDPARFMDAGEYKKQVSGYMRDMKGMKKAEGHSAIYSPGEIEAGKWETASKTGVELDETAISAIDELLRKVGADMVLGG